MANWGGRNGKRVYPRPRGVTISGAVNRAFGLGLSPPTRGNRYAVRAAARQVWSIPAHAG